MIDFPNAPTVGQVFYASNGIAYRWDGTTWIAGPTTGPGYGPTGDFFATMLYPGVNVGATMTTLMPPVVSGNAGGWYNVANGRYTPPPGRYFLHADVSGYAATAAAGYLGVQLRKNGVAVQDNYAFTGYSYYAAPTVSATLDANGTDWFDMQASCNQTQTVSESITFLAYPIAGAKGPPGDQGPPPTAGGGLIRDVLLTSPQPTIDVLNLGVKSCMILFKFGVSVAANVSYQHMVGSTPDATNGYYYTHLYQTGTTVGGSLVGPATSQVLTSVDVGYWQTGQITVPDVTGFHGQKICDIATLTGGQWYNMRPTHFTAGLSTSVNGYRFFPSTGNFVAGSLVRVIGWP